LAIQTIQEDYIVMSRTGIKLAIIVGAITAIIGLSSPSTEAVLPAVAADANTVYTGKCALCHAKNGQGTPGWRAKGQPDFTDANWQRSRTDAQLLESIKNGKGRFMPAFNGKVSDQDIAGLVAKVRGFARR
jgi:mono/diheme cytochrome c family protein